MSTDGDRELAAKICDTYSAALYDGERWNGNIAADQIAQMIAAHTRATVERETAELRAESNERLARCQEYTARIEALAAKLTAAEGTVAELLEALKAVQSALEMVRTSGSAPAIEGGYQTPLMLARTAITKATW